MRIRAMRFLFSTFFEIFTKIVKIQQFLQISECVNFIRFLFSFFLQMSNWFCRNFSKTPRSLQNFIDSRRICKFSVNFVWGNEIHHGCSCFSGWRGTGRSHQKWQPSWAHRAACATREPVCARAPLEPRDFDYNCKKKKLFKIPKISGTHSGKNYSLLSNE